MTKLLEEIFYGEEGGYDSLVRGTPEYSWALRQYHEARNALEQKLPAELSKEFEECISTCRRVGEEAEEAAFGFGIQFGVELMWEVARTR